MKSLLAERRIIRNPIRSALRLARQITPSKLPADCSLEIRSLVTGFNKEIDGIKSVQNTLLGVEKSEHARLQEQIITLEKRRAPLLTQLRKIGHQRRTIEIENERIQKYCGEYHKLDLSPLRWRNAAGFPLLALFSLMDDRFMIKAKRISNGYGVYETRDIRRPKGLPSKLQACYDDVFCLIVEKSSEKLKTITLEAQFTGAIPFEEKAKINKACRVFEGVYIMAEVGKWNLKESAPTMTKVDPLVIGWDGKDLWLVTSFDTTTIEKYVEQVHAGKQLEETKN